MTFPPNIRVRLTNIVFNEEINEAINELKAYSASGADGIPAAFLKTVDTQAKPLCFGRSHVTRGKLPRT